MNSHEIVECEAVVVSQPPDNARKRLNYLLGEQNFLLRQCEGRVSPLERVGKYLESSDEVKAALTKLGEKLFGNVVAVIEEELSIALQEILEQDLRLKTERGSYKGAVTVTFRIERGDGQREDVMKGQGGSVANVLSVGLRLFALTTLDEKEHRRFLILDEQDCWLRPDLVPRLVKIVQEVCKTLNFQVLMISHHDVSTFDRYADRIYELTPTVDGVSVQPRRLK
jgi:DNA repair exonuclease SbcCD ATPase subunit